MSLDALALQMTEMQLKYTKELSAVLSTEAAIGQDRLLIYLYKEKDHILVGDLCSVLEMSTGRVANILKQLEKKGYITRIQQKEDKRKYEVCLTDSGKTYSASLYEHTVAAHRNVIEQLGEEDAKKLLDIFEKVLKLQTV